MNVEKIRKAIEHLKTLYTKSTAMINGRLKGGYVDKEKPENKAIDLAIQALIKQLVNQKTFEWQKYTRKNGTEFLKLIYYSNEVDGYVEVGRFNMSKNEYIQNNWTLDEILRELEG